MFLRCLEEVEELKRTLHVGTVAYKNLLHEVQSELPAKARKTLPEASISLQPQEIMDQEARLDFCLTD